MREITVWLARDENSFALPLRLPANYETIVDLIERTNQSPENCKIVDCHLANDMRFLDSEKYDNIDIFELNFLAVTLQNMERFHYNNFCAGMLLLRQDKPLSVHGCINVALNVMTNDAFITNPATDDADLGQFCVDNEISEQLTKIPEEIYDWVIDKLDFEKVGADLRANEGGLHTKYGYVRKEGELADLYEGVYRMPLSLGGVFLLKLVKLEENENPDDVEFKELRLPINDSNFNYEECLTGYTLDEFHAALPQLNDVMHDLHDEVERLNVLAQRIQTVTADCKLTLYKAMLSTLPETTIENALAACYQCDNFTLDTATISPKEYAENVISEYGLPMKDALLDNINLHKYGSELMEQDGAEQTPYGILKSVNGLTLSENMRQVLQQTQTPEIGGY